jgi:hypothetical protein
MDVKLTGGQLPQLTPEFLRERKFLMWLPLLTIPFLTMAFVALGGGTKNASIAETSRTQGLNATLPQAQFKDQKAQNKMDIYQVVKTDSAGSAVGGVSEGFIKSMGLDAAKNNHTDSIIQRSTANLTGGPTSADVSEAKIQAKLASINQQINQPEPASYTNQTSAPAIRRLNKMMKTMNSGSDEDPEMKQLNNMLTKIQAIQNPGLVNATVLPKKENDTAFRAIPAVIDGKQKVMNGGTVRLKLTDSVKLKGVVLQKGQLLFGACQVTNQRLLLNIQNIRVGKDILPADLTVFSLDGMPGIPAPEAELSGAAGSGANNAIESMQFLSMDQSLGTQAATGGINAAKDLFRKKVKKIRVKLQDNFVVLLRDNTRKR